jgi:hypothetical protein
MRPSRHRSRSLLVLPLVLAGAGTTAQGQQARPAVDCAALKAADHGQMDHAAHLASLAACQDAPGATPPGAGPSQAGQAAFAAIAEIVAMLEADSTTDWSRVNIEALRQHLIDMDEVTLRAVVAQRNVPGGIEADVTGSGATIGSIQRMLLAHGSMMAAKPQYRVQVAETAAGVHLVVVAGNPDDARLVARIRGLGVAGLLTAGAHHAPHHLALARGVTDPHGH